MKANFLIATLSVAETTLIIIGAVLLFVIIALFAVAYFAFKNVLRTKRESKLDPDRFSQPELKDFYKKALKHREFILAQNYERPEIKSFDNLTLKGIFVMPETPSNKTVLCIHGYTSRGLNEFPTAALYFRSLGYNALLVDDRAHGESEGKTIGFSTLDREDCKAWINYLLDRFGGNCTIFLYGISMGSSTVMLTSACNLPSAVKGVIADCGFTSGWEMIALRMKLDYHLPAFPMMQMINIWCRLLGKYSLKKYSCPEELKKAKVPMLFIHGEADDFVPIDMTYRNYEACAAPKTIQTFEGAVHARSYGSDPARYEKILKDFITENE